jgi:hypothetical protein
MPAEKVRLRIGNLAKAVLVTGQTYQDPKDALNEFVSNAADEYIEADRRGDRIRLVLRRRGRSPVIAIDDGGRGMTPTRLREVAQSLFESEKSGDARTLGEKAVGVLAFQQLGGRCDLVSRHEGSSETWVLRLERGSATATLERERRRARPAAGTTVYLHDLDPEVLRLLTRRKVVDYLRVRRGAAIARGDYALEVVEGRSSEVVTAAVPDGVRLDIPSRNTLWGRIEMALYVAPPDGTRRRVAVVGRAGATIIDDLCELEELDGPPWSSDQVSGFIAFDPLQQSTGRRAILRDRAAFPVFLDAVTAVAPAVARAVERVAREIDADAADRMADEIRRIFQRVLKELADLDNPMRAPMGTAEGDGALLAHASADGGQTVRSAPGVPPGAPELDPEGAPHQPPASARPERGRSGELPSLAPDPDPGPARSRFDPEAAVVLYNDHHPDYLTAKEDEGILLDYLATLVAKEYVLYNNPRAAAADLSEEMVRVLVRVRRHLPRRRRAPTG